MHTSGSNLPTLMANALQRWCAALVRAFSLCSFDVACSGIVANLWGSLQKNTRNMIYPEHWNVAGGHSDIAALSIQSVSCFTSGLWVSCTFLSFFFSFPSLVLISCVLDLSLPSHNHLLSLFHPFADYGSLCICLSNSLPFMPSFPPLSHTGIKETHWL